MLGLTPKEALRRFDSIIEFAELEDFVDLKLKNYSSGMQVRLAFSVMIQVDADILLIDEVLAVGDAAFQQKCFDAFRQMKDAGKTILFVTHDMGAVSRFCDRAMLIDRGRVELIGAPDEVGTRYLERNFGREVAAPSLVTGGEERTGDRSAEIVEAWFEHGGTRTDVLPQGQPCTLHLRDALQRAAARPDHRLPDRERAPRPVVGAVQRGRQHGHRRARGGRGGDVLGHVHERVRARADLR